MSEDRSGRLGKQIHKLVHHMVNALSPNGGACTYCRAALRGSSATANPLKLCKACFERIPWIREIHCMACGRYEACYDCRRRENAALLRNRSAVQYNAIMKDWLSLFKYRGDEGLLLLFASMLMHAYHKLLESEGMVNTRFDVITFVPLSDERLMERGFNQAELLARELGRSVGIPVVGLLKRLRHTHKQSFKGRSERLEDLNGAFGVNVEGIQGFVAETATATPNRPLHILLIDDVYTTGSTLNQCAAEIRKHLPTAEVYGLTWAR
ncbi:MAG: ComF family protein [Paenibacillaceae bacterium]